LCRFIHCDDKPDKVGLRSPAVMPWELPGQWVTVVGAAEIIKAAADGVFLRG
jgi:hypothetical protein